MAQEVAGSNPVGHPISYPAAHPARVGQHAVPKWHGVFVLCDVLPRLCPLEMLEAESDKYPLSYSVALVRHPSHTPHQYNIAI